MSLLSQLAPRRADTLTTIDIAGSTAADLPDSTLPHSEGTPATRKSEDLLRILLCDGADDADAIATLEAGVDEQVDVWTPALHTTSRFELVSALVGHDDAIGDIAVTFTESAQAGSMTFLEWQATGRFVRPAFLDDDHLLEPSGAVIRLAGAASLSFLSGGRADRVRCYYDRLALVEQLLAARPIANGV